MGRSYWFECSKCGYLAKVSGRDDRGLDLFVQTIACRDCKQLYDAVTRLRFPAQNGANHHRLLGSSPTTFLNRVRVPKRPPSFLSALNRLRAAGTKLTAWVHFPLQCPVSPAHRVEPWNDPDKCPRCGIYLEKSAIPYRLWD